jgi:hypothetical protein
MQLRSGKIITNNITNNPLFDDNNERIMKQKFKYLLQQVTGNSEIIANSIERIELITDVFRFLKKEMLEIIVKYEDIIPENKQTFYETIFDLVKNKYFQLTSQLQDLEKNNEKIIILEDLLLDCFNLVNIIEITKM